MSETTTNGGREMNNANIMQKLAATDGKNGSTWDPEILREAAEACAAGQMPEDFSGRPENADECAWFSAVWREIQKAK
jgi:hypothetical protein